MAKLTLSSIPSGYATAAAHNADNTAIETAIENTLSRDGTSPNQMNANLDMNGYAILNQRATSGNENFIWMGTWATGTTYSVNNLVYAPEGSNTGNTLICVTAHTAGATLDGDAAKWAVFAQRGAVGGGTGDVVGPASSTADSLVRYNGTTGKLIKDGAVIGTDVQAYNANLAALTAFTTDTDGTLAADSDTKLATQKATKAYADSLISSSTTATPDVTADYFLFEDATDSTQKKALLSSVLSLTNDTMVALSGTSVTFSSVPSWVKKVTIMLSAASTNGSSNPLIQIGDSGGLEVSGYSSGSNYLSAATANTIYTTGFGIYAGSAPQSLYGAITLYLMNPGTNLWAAQGILTDTAGAATFVVAGTKALSGTLDRVAITTVNGTDAFDAGYINILYE